MTSDDMSAHADGGELLQRIIAFINGEVLGSSSGMAQLAFLTSDTSQYRGRYLGTFHDQGLFTCAAGFMGTASSHYAEDSLFACCDCTHEVSSCATP